MISMRFFLMLMQLEKMLMHFKKKSININKILMDIELILKHLVFISLDFETIWGDSDGKKWG